MSLQRLLTLDDVAEILSVHRDTVRKLVYRGKLAHVRVGAKSVRFTEEQVEALVKELTRPAKSQPPPKSYPLPRMANGRLPVSERGPSGLLWKNME